MSRVAVKFPGRMPAGVALRFARIPDAWLVEHGYAEWREAHNAPPLNRQGHGYPGGLPGPSLNPGIRYIGTSDRDQRLFHYFYGRPAPATRYVPGVAGFEQWDYSPTKKAYKGRVTEICAPPADLARAA